MTLIESIGLIATGVVSCVILLGLIARSRAWRLMYENEVERSRQLMQQALIIENAHGQMMNEYQNWKRIMGNISERPVVANLSDRQAQDLTQAIISYCEAMRHPEKMN